MTGPCIDQVPRDDPRIPLTVDMVANAYTHRLPFRYASYATQHGRIDMARELLATLDKHRRTKQDSHNHEFYDMCACGVHAADYFSGDN